MSTITKESIADTIEGLEHLANSGIQSVYIDMAIAGMRRLLAGLDAEPMFYVDGEAAKRLIRGHTRFATMTNEPKNGATLPLYTAPPAPASEQNSRAITQHFDTLALETAREIMCDVNRRHEFLGGEVQLLSRIQCRIDDACRAAMLQGADGNSPVIPAGWKLVPVELTGAMTNAMTDAILDDLHNVDVWRSVLAAAPQQEVK